MWQNQMLLHSEFGLIVAWMELAHLPGPAVTFIQFFKLENKSLEGKFRRQIG